MSLIQFENQFFLRLFKIINFCYNNMVKVSYEGKEYGVLEVIYKDHILPVLLDWNDYKYVNKLNFK